MKFYTEVKTFLWRELCLRFIIYGLVLILFEKTGNFL